MRMMFYLASSDQLLRIHFNPESPSFNTRDLDVSEQNIRTHFSHKNVLYVGADEKCGCGFRHALIEKEEWVIYLEADERFQKNHIALFEFISDNIKDGFVEI